MPCCGFMAKQTVASSYLTLQKLLQKIATKIPTMQLISVNDSITLMITITKK